MGIEIDQAFIEMSVAQQGLGNVSGKTKTLMPEPEQTRHPGGGLHIWIIGFTIGKRSYPAMVVHNLQQSAQYGATVHATAQRDGDLTTRGNPGRHCFLPLLRQITTPFPAITP